MAKLSGWRCLWGLGTVCAWLVLFYLLVNLWLLCVFTSLLMVIGSCFGSMAFLESNSMIHLERFITPKQIPPTMEDEQQLDKEIHDTVRKIIRDFVSSWYSTVSTESTFEKEVQTAMVSMAMELKNRSRQVELKDLTQKIMNLFGCHLQDYIRAKQTLFDQKGSSTTRKSTDRDELWNTYSRFSIPHLAVSSPAEEMNYIRTVVDLLLQVLVPLPHLETHTGGFVVGELITCNVLLPVIAKLSDPDWVNIFIMEVFAKSNNPKASIAADPQTSLQPSPPATTESQHPLQQKARQSLYFPLSTVTQRTKIDDTTAANELIESDIDLEEMSSCLLKYSEEGVQEALKYHMKEGNSTPLYQGNVLHSQLADLKQSSIESMVMSGQEGLIYVHKECAINLDNNNSMESEDVVLNQDEISCLPVQVNLAPVVSDNVCGSLISLDGTNNFQDMQKNAISLVSKSCTELPLGIEQIEAGNDLTLFNQLQSSATPPFSFEALSSPDGPVIIQKLRISGTITAKEYRGTGSHPYTLYTIKYETAMGCENSLSSQSVSKDLETVQIVHENSIPIQPVAYHTVNRRYSEFLNLQSRLLEKPELRKLIKGVKGPKKIFPDMPFGNMDSEKIEARKGLLETFVKQLCAIPEIANSEEMQEFLALNTDARIAFVKKPLIVARIDKIVVNAIVDTLKTAFPRADPQSPTDENEGEVDGGKMTAERKREKFRPRFSGKNCLSMNNSDLLPPVLFSLEQMSPVFTGRRLEDLKVIITAQESSANSPDPDRESNLLHKEYKSSQKNGERKKLNEETGAVCETALAELALNILCLVMREKWGWLCTENIQKATRLLFGTLINRWLDMTVTNLMCPRYWALYLRVIQEAVWPDGALPAAPQLERTKEQKDDTKYQALKCLMSLLPDLITDTLGVEKYKHSWQTALDSFQDSHINRHLLYSLCDILLEFLVPELPGVEFQRSMLERLTRTPELPE